MAQDDTRSLQQIRQETEQTRAALATTVQELRGTVTDTATDIRNRLRPDSIKAEVSGYVRSRGEQLLHDMTDAARRNPMQAIAVGASVAYPVIRMARSIPLPVLMIGAGLFLAGTKTGRDLTQKAADFAEDVSDEAQRRAQQLGDQASHMAADLGDRASDALGRVGESITGTADHVQQTGASAAQAARSRLDEGMQGMQDAAGEATDAISSRTRQMKDAVSNTAESASSAARETASRITDTMRSAQSRAAEAGREFLDTARERGEKAAATVQEQARENPVLVAGVGLLIGGLIASALPKSATEESLMGQASNRVKRKAGQAAAAGYGAAKEATGEVLADAAEQAAAEGLTPERLAESAEDVRHRLQHVADRAVTTAFDPDHHNEDNRHSEDTGRGKEHG